SPSSLTLSGLGALQRSSKNSQIVHSLLSMIPPALVDKHFPEVAEDLLTWTAVNFSSVTDITHHTERSSGFSGQYYPRIAQFLTERYGVDGNLFHQAQLTAWKLCYGSSDVGLVQKN